MPALVTSTPGCCFCFGCLFILSQIIPPTLLQQHIGHLSGEFIFQCPIFLLFHTVHGVLKARMLKWFAIAFSSGPHFVRIFHHDPSILGGLTEHVHSFIELYKAVVYVISLIGFLWLWFSFGLLSDKDKRLMEASWWERLTVGETGSWSAGQAMLSKSLIQFSVDGRAVFPPCCLAWDQTMVEVMKMMELPSKVPCTHCCTHCPQLCIRPLLTHASARDSWTLTGKPGPVCLVGTLLLSPGSWCTQGFVRALQKSVSPVLCKFWWLSGGVNSDLFQEAYATTRSAAPRALPLW